MPSGKIRRRGIDAAMAASVLALDTRGLQRRRADDGHFLDDGGDFLDDEEVEKLLALL